MCSGGLALSSMAIRMGVVSHLDIDRDGPPDFSDPILQQIMDEATRQQSVTICAYGKPGSGKTSIVSNIVNDEDMKTNDGWDSVTKTTNRVRIEVDEVSVNVVDTQGVTSSASAAADNLLQDETTELVGRIATNECKGLVIICFEMYARVDESTLKSLAVIYQKFGRYFFRHAIIALTKADLYDEDVWLKLPRHGMSKKQFLQIKFAEEVEKRKTSLKRLFTDQVRPSCRIGMTEEEFDELQIPVIPTSRLNKKSMDRMKQVGHGYWFDLLLIKCCQKLQGSGLIKIHEERLSKLPNELIQQEVSKEVLERLRRNRSMLRFVTILGIIRFYNWCQERQYHKNVTTLTRFDQKEATGDQMKTTANDQMKTTAGED